MSSISNNTLSQEYYYQVTQNSATFAQTATSSTSNADSTSAAQTNSPVINTTPPTIDPNDPSSGIAGANHHRHGGHGGGGGGGLEQILQTVQNALSSSSSSSTDPNQVITNALEQLFGGTSQGTATDNQDADTLIGNSGTTQTAGTTGTTSTASSSSSSTSADADSVDGSDANSPTQTLAQLLQGYGVSPQQFRSDLISALSGSGNSLNESLFQNFEPGSGVDAIA